MIKIDKESSEEIFRSDSKKILKYLDKINIKDDSYLNFIKDNPGGFLLENTIIIHNEEYSVECFYGNSTDENYDLIKVNKKILNLDNKKVLAIANLYGDDAIVLKPNEEGVYFMELDDENVSNLIKLANNFDEFINLIK